VCNIWAPLAAIVVIWQMTVIHFEKHVMAWIIGAVFVMICVPLSLQDIHFHIIHYVHPLQRHYIRILWMIPGPQFTCFTSTSTKVQMLTQKTSKRHDMRILWMMAVYAVESWIALRFNESKIYLETMREARLTPASLFIYFLFVGVLNVLSACVACILTHALTLRRRCRRTNPT